MSAARALARRVVEWLLAGAGETVKATAYHEAGHAVARLFVGAVATDTEICGRGGLSHGTGEIFMSASAGQYRAWDYILVLLAGPYAEARASKRSAVEILLSGGVEDYREAEQVYGWLVTRGFAASTQEAERRAVEEVRHFLRSRWGVVTDVADELRVRGRLTAAELRALVEP